MALPASAYRTRSDFSTEYTEKPQKYTELKGKLPDTKFQENANIPKWNFLKILKYSWDLFFRGFALRSAYFSVRFLCLQRRDRYSLAGGTTFLCMCSPELQAVRIPASVVRIEGEAFPECPFLTLYVHENSFAHPYTQAAGSR